jgi:hypothetical protein
MVDHFSIFLTHGLLGLAIWRLVYRPDLDHEDPPKQKPLPERWKNVHRPNQPWSFENEADQ